MSTEKHILVVEDELSMQALLKHVLANAGYRVDVAINGLEAMKLLGSQRYDIVLSDVMMSAVDGIELCKWIRGHAQLHHLPFVMISSRAEILDIRAGLQAGADAYVTKPFELQRLLVALQEASAQRGPATRP